MALEVSKIWKYWGWHPHTHTHIEVPVLSIRLETFPWDETHTQLVGASVFNPLISQQCTYSKVRSMYTSSIPFLFANQSWTPNRAVSWHTDDITSESRIYFLERWSRWHRLPDRSPAPLPRRGRSTLGSSSPASFPCTPQTAWRRRTRRSHSRQKWAGTGRESSRSWSRGGRCRSMADQGAKTCGSRGSLSWHSPRPPFLARKLRRLPRRSWRVDGARWTLRGWWGCTASGWTQCAPIIKHSW